jgi:hypothetical protein
MKEFKCRASCTGQIMTNPRTKSEIISQTALTHLEKWMKTQIYGIEEDFSNKYTEKGEIVEDDAIDLAIEHLGLIYSTKNEEHFHNEYLKGTPDLLHQDEVIDIKASWDPFTFPLFHKSLPTPKGTPNKHYYYQLQSYMALTGRKKARLVYVLCDTPQHLIEKEAMLTLNGRDYDERLQELTKRMTYSHIPLEYRVKAFEIERDDKVIQAIYERVELCREILETYNQPVI